MFPPRRRVPCRRIEAQHGLAEESCGEWPHQVAWCQVRQRWEARCSDGTNTDRFFFDRPQNWWFSPLGFPSKATNTGVPSQKRYPHTILMQARLVVSLVPSLLICLESFCFKKTAANNRVPIFLVATAGLEARITWSCPSRWLELTARGGPPNNRSAAAFSAIKSPSLQAIQTPKHRQEPV